GEVRQPSNLSLKTGGLTLMQALAMVGGVNANADVKDIKIYRKKPNSLEKEIISVNYKDVKTGKQRDVSLEPYDEIEVGKAKKKPWEYILELAIGAGKGTLNSVTGSVGYRILY
nr:SLBB domain-containing protein [Pyrinomonadaceae bacterium]